MNKLLQQMMKLGDVSNKYLTSLPKGYSTLPKFQTGGNKVGKRWYSPVVPDSLEEYLERWFADAPAKPTEVVATGYEDAPEISIDDKNRLLKTMIAYNHGASATVDKLGNIKKKGKSIYGNTDWVDSFNDWEARNYGKKIVLDSDEAFNKEYDSAVQVNPYVKLYDKYYGKDLPDYVLDKMKKQAYLEARFKPNAYNPSGATGFTQVKPIALKEFNRLTGKNYKMEDLYNPEIAIEVQYELMKHLYNRPWATKTAEDDFARGGEYDLPKAQLGTLVKGIGKAAKYLKNTKFVKGAFQMYPKGPVTAEEAFKFVNTPAYKKAEAIHNDAINLYGSRWELPNYMEEALKNNNRYIINPELYGSHNWGPGEYLQASVLGTTVPILTSAGGYMLAPTAVQNKINKSVFGIDPYEYDKLISKKDTTIDLTNRSMNYARVNENADGTVIIGGEFIEDNPNSVRKAADWIKSKDTFGDKELESNKVKSFYGVENGKFKVGKASEFKSNTLIVPIRFGDNIISKAVVGDKDNKTQPNTMRLLDKDNNIIYHNTPVFGKFILYSPSTKRSEFVFMNNGDSGIKKVNEFIKNNKDAQYIHLDNGRYEYYAVNKDGLSPDDFERYYRLDLKREGNPGYNLVIKKTGGSVLPKFQKAGQFDPTEETNARLAAANRGQEFDYEAWLDSKFGKGPVAAKLEYEKFKRGQSKQAAAQFERQRRTLPSPSSGAIEPTAGPIEAALFAPAAGGAFTGANNVLNMPAYVGGRAVPWLTGNNVLTAGAGAFSTQQILDPNSDFRTNPNLDNSLMTGLGLLPFVGPAIASAARPLISSAGLATQKGLRGATNLARQVKGFNFRTGETYMPPKGIMLQKDALRFGIGTLNENEKLSLWRSLKIQMRDPKEDKLFNDLTKYFDSKGISPGANQNEILNQSFDLTDTPLEEAQSKIKQPDFSTDKIDDLDKIVIQAENESLKPKQLGSQDFWTNKELSEVVAAREENLEKLKELEAEVRRRILERAQLVNPDLTYLPKEWLSPDFIANELEVSPDLKNRWEQLLKTNSELDFRKKIMLPGQADFLERNHPFHFSVYNDTRSKLLDRTRLPMSTLDPMEQWNRGMRANVHKDIDYPLLINPNKFSPFSQFQQFLDFQQPPLQLNTKNQYNSLLRFKPQQLNKLGGPIVSSRGQWDYPGQDTIVPTPNGRITMKGVPYPVYGQDETGHGKMMYPGREYKFPGKAVYEKPIMQTGGEQYNTPEAWEKAIRDVEHRIGKPFKWTKKGYNELQDILNQYKSWRENTAEGRAVRDNHNERNEYVVPLPPHLHGSKLKERPYIDSVLNANRGLNWIQRLYDEHPQSIQIQGQPGRSTHFMESGDGRVYPTVVQMPDGSLKYLDNDAYNYADSTKSFIQFPSDAQAQWFSKNYKRGTGVLKGFQTGGQALIEYQNRGQVEHKPIYVSDKNDPALIAYQDSLAAYNMYAARLREQEAFQKGIGEKKYQYPQFKNLEEIEKYAKSNNDWTPLINHGTPYRIPNTFPDSSTPFYIGYPYGNNIKEYQEYLKRAKVAPIGYEGIGGHYFPIYKKPTPIQFNEDYYKPRPNITQPEYHSDPKSILYDINLDFPQGKIPGLSIVRPQITEQQEVEEDTPEQTSTVRRSSGSNSSSKARPQKYRLSPVYADPNNLWHRLTGFGFRNKFQTGGQALTKYQTKGQVSQQTEDEKSAAEYQDWIRNWYQKRKLNYPVGQQILDMERPGILKSIENFPGYVRKRFEGPVGFQKVGYPAAMFDKNKNQIFIQPETENDALFHEYNHYAINNLKHDPGYLRSLNKFLIDEAVIPNTDEDSRKYDYLTSPDEAHTLIMDLRKKAGFKPEQIVTPEDLQKFLKTYKGEGNIDELIKYLKSSDHLLYLLNNMADSSKAKRTRNDDILSAMYGREIMKNGGQMIRRADGSYSRRGLWDNIRENKGSGKKPTKQMLEQERKIKSKGK